jgi:hypothetical protein
VRPTTVNPQSGVLPSMQPLLQSFSSSLIPSRRGDRGAAAQVDADMRGRRSLGDVGDCSRKLVARADFHGLALLWDLLSH